MTTLHRNDFFISPNSGIDSVTRKEIDRLYFPDHEEVFSTHLNLHESLQDLFPIKTFDFFFINQVVPNIFFSVFSKFSNREYLIPELRLSLRSIVLENPSLARKIGGVSKILDDEKQLLELLQHYRSALFQG